MSQKKKILVVDDEIHIVHVITIKFRNNGYDVISAENGKQAFEIACEQKPDIIVTDFQMPGITGQQFVEKLRNNPETKDIPVIMLTAKSFSLDKKKQQQLEIECCLSKPFSPKELLKNVEEILYEKALVGSA